MPTNPSLGWQKIKDIYYALRPCYEKLSWPIENLSTNYKVVISQYSTVMALASKEASFPNLIDVYSITGKKLWSLVYNNTADNHIIEFAFRNEDLLVILSNQKFRYYKDFDGNFDEYCFTEGLIQLEPINNSLTSQDMTDGPKLNYITNLENDENERIYQVLEAQIWDKFLIMKLSDSLIITDLDSLKNYEIHFSKIDVSKFHCLKPLRADQDGFVLLASYNETVLSVVVDMKSGFFEILDHDLTDGPFSMISASPNGHLVALVNDKVSTIFVTNSKFNQVLLEYDISKEAFSPSQVEWCANDAIVISSRDELTLIGPGQQSISFFYDIIEEDDNDFELMTKDQESLTFTIPIIKSEHDGLKVFTSNKVEFLGRVSNTAINLFQIGSSHPSSILLDCVEKFGQQSFKAYTNISFLKSEGSLVSAMDDCLEASLDDFSPFWQKRLLKAASFGMAYNDEAYDADDYLKTVNTLKVLNQLRSIDVGIFVTFNELSIVGWETIIGMLLKRKMHYLAIKIVKIMLLQNLQDMIYIHWCCSKIIHERAKTDTDLFKDIAHKLAKTNVSILQIYDVAYQEGRLNLCKLLVNLEPSISKRINKILNEDPETALVMAFQTVEYELCKLILLYLQSNFNEAHFLKILNQNEQKKLISNSLAAQVEGVDFLKDSLYISGDLISHFWIESIGMKDEKLLERFYRQEDRRTELDMLRLEQSMITKDHKKYKTILLKSINSSPKRKEANILRKELKIVDLKARLTETYQIEFYQLHSLSEILIKLIEMNQIKPASKIVREFKVEEEKFWYLVLKTCCRLKEFNLLHDFIASHSHGNKLKTQIPFERIIEACFASNCPKGHLSEYILNYDANYADKVKLFVKNKDFTLAGKEAMKNKDVNSLKYVMGQASNANDENAIKLIEDFIKKLGR
ncbi:uncharacterized protein PRCAT00005496001 [Priceomyces carsonii]|uniref:uncharacterized protein n=1 Tax=Priceomyces carsonii TaxID=28549 RepID=UPI002EDAC914|nr:unnamed protein product [Priceomyces carsonii]